MHKLIDFICDELDDLERKSTEGKLTMQDVEYGDMLAHFKKNLLTADAMMDAEDYGSYDDGMSMARGRRNARRDSMGRYSRRGGSYRNYPRDGYRDGYSREEAKADLLNELREMHMESADDETKQMIKSWMNQLEQR